MTSSQRRKAVLRTVKVLKYWQDADIFDLDVKKKISEHVVEELEDFFGAIQDVEDEDRGETQPLEQGFMDMEPEEQEVVQ